MNITVVGAGPGGTTAALLFARAGYTVTLVDRDPGPRDATTWDRMGVMQFLLPHGLRAPGRLFLESLLPDIHAALLDAGAVLSDVPPGAPPFATGLHVRRSVFERVLWAAADSEPGITRMTGHVDDVAATDWRVRGVVVDGVPVPADLVVDATGRAGRLGTAYRPEGETTTSPFAYAAREYRLRPGAQRGPTNGGPGLLTEHDGFLEMVFQQDNGTFQTLIVRRAHDEDLAQLRHEAAHTAVSALLPGISAWTDPTRAEPIGPVRVGAGLLNRYRPQASGVVGLLAIGDAVLVTNPMGARGLTFAMTSAAALVDIVMDQPESAWADALDAWCDRELQPWYADHCAVDQTMLARWDHEPIDPDGPIGWDIVLAAARSHPEWMPQIGPFLGMFAPPASIDPFREQTRAMIRDGWQPEPQCGVDREELVATIRSCLDPVGV